MTYTPAKEQKGNCT